MLPAANPEVRIEELQPGHIPAAADLICRCVGGRVERRKKLLETLLGSREGLHRVYAAFMDDRLVGQARASYFAPPRESPPNVAPEGWYLLGLNVDPDCRRRGIGTSLTERRLDWLTPRAEGAWYFTLASNVASLALHRGFGFEEVTRDFWFPKVKYRGEPRVLCRLNFDPRPRSS